MNEFLERLAAVAGAEAVRPGTETRVAGVQPLAVVEPATADGVAGVLKLCSEEGVAVEPSGGGTWLRAGRWRGDRPPVVVSTRRLAGVTEYVPADLVVGVSAGMTLGALANVVGEQGQRVMLDPPATAGATVGGTLALGAAGPLRAKYGTPRDMVLGVEVATGDGRLLRFGGRVVKNVAGYDLVRLLTGSRGRLGIITSTYLLVRGAPEADATLIIPAHDASAAASLAHAIAELNMADAIEVLGTRTGPGAAWKVAVRVLGSSGLVAAAKGRIGRVARAAGSAPIDEDPAVWHAFSQDEAAAAMALRLDGPPSILPRLLGLAEAFVTAMPAAGATTDEWRISAHAANGIVRVWCARALDDAGSRLMAAAAELAADAVRAGAALSWPVLPPDLHGAIQQFPTRSEGVLRLEASIRAAFDPAGILSDDRHG